MKLNDMNFTIELVEHNNCNISCSGSNSDSSFQGTGKTFCQM